MKYNRSILILLLVIIIALAFRVPALLNSKSFWLDEIVSIEIAKKGILESWEYLQWENNPPLHYWCLHFWVKLFGEEEKIVRLSSLLLSVLGIVAIYFLGKELKNKRVGFTAAFLMAVSSHQVYLSMDARMYPMLMLFSILSCYYFWKVVNLRAGRLDWAGYIVFTILAFYTHLTALFLFLIHNFYFAYHHYYLKQKRPTMGGWLIVQAVILGLFSPWLIVFGLRTLAVFNSGAWYLNTSANGFFLWQLPFSFIFLGARLPIVELLAWLLFVILMSANFVRFNNWFLVKKEVSFKLNFGKEKAFAWLVFLIPVFVGFFIQVWVDKYYLAASIGLFLVLAIGMSSLNISRLKRILLLLLIFFLVLTYNFSIIKNQHQHQWDILAQYVEAGEQEGDLILLSAFVYELPFRYYYKGNLRIEGYQPEGLEDDLLLKVIKYNWYSILEEDNLPDMNRIIGDSDRVLVINATVASSIHKSGLAIDWFLRNGWKLVSRKGFGGFIQSEIIIFERNE